MTERFAFALLAVLLLTAAAAAQRAPRFSEAQLDAKLKRCEALLAQGNALQALRASLPTGQALFDEYSFDFDRWEELSNRGRSVAWTAVVRLRGAYDVKGNRAKDPRAVLRTAEERQRELLDEGNPDWNARHAESLVALGDRMQDAYDALAPLHEDGKLREPETYAALATAARALGHTELASVAHARCIALAKARAKRTCGS